MPRILYVEDNDDNVYMLKQRLRAEGLRGVGGRRRRGRASRPRASSCPTSSSSTSACRSSTAGRRRRRSRPIERTRAIPIIALSAHAMADDRAQALEAGCEDYDTKPVDLPRLLGKMQALLAPGSAPRDRGRRAHPRGRRQRGQSLHADRAPEARGLRATSPPPATVRRRLDRLAGEPFDLVLLDVMMPVLDGIETLARIKADPRAAPHPGDHDLGRHRPDAGRRAASSSAPRTTCPSRSTGPSCAPASAPRSSASGCATRSGRTSPRSRRSAGGSTPACTRSCRPRPWPSSPTSGRIAPRRYEGVAVLFADIIGFTAYCDCHAPEERGRRARSLRARLRASWPHTHGLEKIKTVGDAVLLTANLLLPHPEPVQACIACADAMIETAARAARPLAGARRHPARPGRRRDGGRREVRLRHLGRHGQPGRTPLGADDGAGHPSRRRAADRVRGVVGLADLGQVTLKGAGASQVFRALQPAPEAR